MAVRGGDLAADCVLDTVGRPGCEVGGRVDRAQAGGLGRRWAEVTKTRVWCAGSVVSRPVKICDSYQNITGLREGQTHVSKTQSTVACAS